MMIAILAFGLLRTLISAWYAGVEASSATRLVTRNAVSIIFPLPQFYKDKIQQLRGVKTVSYGTWFGGVYGDEKNFFANFAVEAKTFLELYPEFIIPSNEKESFLKDQKGCVIGKKLADRFGWKVGDLVTLKGTIFLGNWDFVVRAIYQGRDKDTDESQFFFHWNYLNEIQKKVLPSWTDQVGVLYDRRRETGTGRRGSRGHRLSSLRILWLRHSRKRRRPFSKGLSP